MADTTSDRPRGGDADGDVPAPPGTPTTVLAPPEDHKPPRRGPSWRIYVTAGLFLLPALVLLGALVVYPIFFTVVRSFHDRAGDFTGVDNYQAMFTSSRTRTAIRNNAIWVVVAPTVVTAVGLVLAVLTERIRWATAFKVVLFMPMAVSLLAAGVIFRLVYDADPDRGVANAVTTAVVDVVRPPGPYPGAGPSEPTLEPLDDGGFETVEAVSSGSTVTIGLVRIAPALVPDDAQEARLPEARPGTVTGLVWLDFTPGGTGERGVVDPGEVGLPGIDIELVRADGTVAGRTTTDVTGSFEIDDVAPGDHHVRLAASSFRPAWGGVSWLGPTLVTPSIIGAYIWIWAGFALVVIAAGLAAIPRETLEAARMDGATEWQVFRRVTAPLLAPVLLVVLVTLTINVLKIFDLVLVIPPGATASDANVIAVEMWRVSFGGARDQGLGSALAVFLFLLVLPAMAFNIRRFRAEV